MSIEWPTNFPNEEEMISLLKDTIENVWNVDLNVSEIKDWLGNFTGKVYDISDERKLALWLLCNYTYYNEQEVNHLCNLLYKKFLHEIAVSGNIKDTKELNDILKKTYFAAMGNASESGAMLLYFFRQEANISISRFVYPTSFPEDPDCICVFIDDVTLSGSTASRFFERNKKDLENKKIYYITLFATNDAVNELSHRGIKMLYCSLLDDRDKAFSEESMIFSKFKELREPSKKMVYEYGKMIKKEYPLGFRNGELCFGFHYNTPNNSLPIFWAKNNKWKPILQRKEKIYGRQETEFCTYI